MEEKSDGNEEASLPVLTELRMHVTKIGSVINSAHHLQNNIQLLCDALTSILRGNIDEGIIDGYEWVDSGYLKELLDAAKIAATDKRRLAATLSKVLGIEIKLRDEIVKQIEKLDSLKDKYTGEERKAAFTRLRAKTKALSIQNMRVADIVALYMKTRRSILKVLAKQDSIVTGLLSAFPLDEHAPLMRRFSAESYIDTLRTGNNTLTSQVERRSTNIDTEGN